jgi:hypothetical protein
MGDIFACPVYAIRIHLPPCLLAFHSVRVFTTGLLGLVFSFVVAGHDYS